MKAAHFIFWSLFIALCLAGCSRNNSVAVAPKNGSDEPLGPPLFEDKSAALGEVFKYRTGEEHPHYAILESLGGGTALIDFDKDGLYDIFAAGGGYYDGPNHQEIKGHPSRLYKNLGNWQFKDVTKDAGLDAPLFYTHGGAVADYDRDGWPDLLVTGWRRVVLYHNVPVDPKDPKKGRTFVDVTKQAGFTPGGWTTSAAWADLDGDGYPDLYVCHYVNWSFDNHPPCQGYTSDVKKDVCPPSRFEGLPHQLFRNNGNGTFTDVSKEAGLKVVGMLDQDGKQVGMGKGLGVIAVDLNMDRKPDIYVANDTVNNFLYYNRGNWKFEEMALLRGVACDERGVAQGSMGLAVGDYERGGWPSLFVTNYENELHALYRNLGVVGSKEQFLFSTSVTGIAAIGQKYVGFGTAFVDVDQDGWEDIIIANGHVIRHPKFAGLAQKPVLLRNLGKGKFRDITKQGGPYFHGEHRSRGLAMGDLDNDGRADFVISNVQEPLKIIRGIIGEGGKRPHWLGLELRGKDNADIVGTRIILEAGGDKQTRFVYGGGSYLATNDPRHLFGLGDLTKITRITIEWASGEDQVIDGKDLAVDRYYRIAQGEKFEPKLP
ncbi:MAG: CRTAC1 family protein [Gemmataceae bacterium]|nr:CRTAC1 family protein [Gemmataceae bacterium]